MEELEVQLGWFATRRHAKKSWAELADRRFTKAIKPRGTSKGEHRPQVVHHRGKHLRRMWTGSAKPRRHEPETKKPHRHGIPGTSKDHSGGQGISLATTPITTHNQGVCAVSAAVRRPLCAERSLDTASQRLASAGVNVRAEAELVDGMNRYSDYVAGLRRRRAYADTLRVAFLRAMHGPVDLPLHRRSNE